MSDVLDLGQPQEEPKVTTDYSSEDELLDALRKEAESIKSSYESEPEAEEEAEVETESVETEEAQEPENNEEVVDESFDIAGWLKKNPYKVKDRGLEIIVDDPKEVEALLHKGLNYSRKTEELAKVRKVADYAEQHSIGLDDLELLANLKAGNKQALAELAKRNSVDIYSDVDSEASYQPNQEVAYRELSEVDMVAQEIAQDEALYGRVKDALTYVPRNFAESVVSDAKLLRAFSEDIANGVADKVMPIAIRNHAANGGDFLQHYINVANQIFATQDAPQEPTVQHKPVSTQAKAKASVGSNQSGGANAQELDLWENVSEGELIERIKRQASLMKG